MQLTFDLPTNLPKDAYAYGARASGEVHGVVLTKPHVVELILDFARYTSDRDLAGMGLLEPSCGEGAFLIPAVRRLIAAARRASRDVGALEHAIVAFDVEPQHVARTRAALVEVLLGEGVPTEVADRLVAAWVREGDFLLAPIDRRFDVVVGNPPYVRIEQISPALQSEYRRRYVSIYDRADLYVAFIERGLSLLGRTGVLSFICADRWISNKYGAPLRKLVTTQYQLRCYVDLHRASPFESDVIAYPSIFVISPPGDPKPVDVVTLGSASESETRAVVDALSSASATAVSVVRYHSWFVGDEPWVLSSPEHLATLRALEARFQPIETEARVGIGVASGNDAVYIVDASADIESDRLVPLVMRDDIERGQIKDGGHFIINTFEENGGVVDLTRYPRLERYLAKRGAEVKKRHVAQKNPRAWFRTIDRVYPQLVRVPKLLIPDIAGSNEVVFDEGRYHPHHNLYFVASDQWDMEVLGGLLSSRIALFFVWCYAVKMRGGYLRFQAQYLRRIRVPKAGGIGPELAMSLKAAFRARDFGRLDQLALEVYGMDRLPAFDFVDTRR